MLKNAQINREKDRMQLRDVINLKPIETVDSQNYSAEVMNYFKHYGLTFGDSVDHSFGRFESAGYELAGHLFEPAGQSAGTVVLLHGYLNHTGQFHNLIESLLDHHYSVAVFDLPGHGLSNGDEAAIDNFGEYSMILDDFMRIVQQQLAGPYHAIGFSTGCSILIDKCLANQVKMFDKVILAAPLIRWSAYEQSKNTYAVYSKFTDVIPRFHRRNSSDKDFLSFNKTQDYLHAKNLSLRWVKALFDWNDKLDTRPCCHKQILVLQGDEDTTVDWQYNMNKINEKFSDANIQMIPQARHELFNEARELRQTVIGYVLDWLNNN